jgi:hypothetical protein
MAKLLLNLRDVPDDEADEVRALLTRREIPFYETQPSFWGVSAGGIWIKRDEDAAAAAGLMAEYQHERRSRARMEYEAAKRAGAATTTWRALRENPLRTIVVLLGIVIIVALTALPFVMLA